MYEVTTRKLKETSLSKIPLNNINKDCNDRKRCKSVDDAHLLPPPSGYCSSSASGGSDDERERHYYDRNLHVKRCGSSDSAVGLTPSDDEAPHINWTETNEQKYFCSPYSPRGSVDHTNVPTKTLIESQYVQYPIDRKFSDCVSEGCVDSRRQSVFTDDGDDSRYRYFRTPSVVVSDYSDDMIGLTLDDIEYFRNQRKENSSSPDSSLHSSCSNLNYCGSTISNLDSEHLLRKPYRKSSECSLYSLSGDEDGDNLQPVSSKEKVRFFYYLRFFSSLIFQFNFLRRPHTVFARHPCLFNISSSLFTKQFTPVFFITSITMLVIDRFTMIFLRNVTLQTIW